MGFFTSIARQSFITTETGQRVLCTDYPLSKPYVIPDEETESRLIPRLALANGASFVVLVGGMPLAIGLTTSTLMAILSCAAVGAVAIALYRGIVSAHLRNLVRAPTQVPPSYFYDSVARHRTWFGALTLFLFSALFAVGSLRLLWTGSGPVVLGVIVAVMFGALTVVWGYVLKLKFGHHAKWREENL